MRRRDLIGLLVGAAMPRRVGILSSNTEAAGKALFKCGSIRKRGERP